MNRDPKINYFFSYYLGMYLYNIFLSVFDDCPRFATHNRNYEPLHVKNRGSFVFRRQIRNGTRTQRFLYELLHAW